MKKELLQRISLSDLRIGPPQVLGGVRLVPLLRDDVRDDLRLSKRSYGEDFAAVNLSCKSSYYSYVPHAFVADWTADSSPVFSFGSQLKKGHRPVKTTDGKLIQFAGMSARVISKMRQKEAKNRLRFLPLDMAMEGFLARHFGGPSIAWEEYSREFLSRGIGSRFESAYAGKRISGLEDALRMFEIHPNQVGVIVFVSDSLASVFVLPHPDDYQALHSTLIKDFFGELIYIYGLSATESVYHPNEMEPKEINAVSDLRRALEKNRSEWSELHRIMITNLIERDVEPELVYQMGPFSMQRFVTGLDPKGENHIGECIVRQDGQRLEYLKSYRLSAAQTRRAYLLSQLAGCEWELDACASKMECTKNQLVLRLNNAGFGYFLHQHVLDAARAEARRQRR